MGQDNRMNKKLSQTIISTALILSLSISFSGCAKDPGKKTLATLTRAADGIYTMDCYIDYKIDDYLAANITDVKQFDTWMTNNLTHGVPTGDIDDIGCSSFAVKNPEGDHLFGRNYDWDNGESIVIRTNPANGYTSIGIADLNHVNLGSHGDYSMDDEKSRSLLFAAPWCICDGINEKGLGVSLLELYDEHVVNDTSKGDLLIYSATRVLLDKCANVDEAIKFLESYDIYTPRSNTYHVFLTDKTGRSVVVEWDQEGSMRVIEDNDVTNFALYKQDLTQDYDQRYAKIRRRIDSADTMSSSDAMEVLKAVYHDTRWSAVYDLEKFSVDICFNGDYEVCFSFNGIDDNNIRS